ncbi:LLM class flavin-dependent oxidoreductase [Serratia sp. UGAL515B_01]|uniref:LLM class flavin-dependent oxidoreductase n=1 Tax=Serratia sp. UGAL515B_01 TaxID=2986763 RepID=UPI002955726B|nr:LLM class flavin-dependent oxidoreductase [Serratia sp. UGAL515B_01]WON77657.1 LLM class flavin-dependent oxidoreductase [Serratia sp. UGAL515B_01]
MSEKKTHFKIGISSIGAHLRDPLTNKKTTEQERIRQLVDMAIQAEAEGLDVYALGESHQEGFVSAAHTVILGAIAQATQKITLMSSVTVISTLDPVRTFEDFATLDLLSNGRTEIVVGRGSRVGGFSLLGYSANDYEALFDEKIDLLTTINRASGEKRPINWQGKFRPPLVNARIFPQPQDRQLKIWHAVGGHSSSAVAAAKRGLPMMLTTLAGESLNFKQAIDAFRKTAEIAGHQAFDLPITTTSWFHTAHTDEQAVEEFYPYFNGMTKELRSDSVPKEFLHRSLAIDNAMMIGSPATIIEKLKYQYRLYKQQQFLAHVDTGALPEALVKNNIDVLANIIAPEIRSFVADESKLSDNHG